MLSPYFKIWCSYQSILRYFFVSLQIVIIIALKELLNLIAHFISENISLRPLVQVIKDVFFLTLPYFTCTKGFPSLGSHSAKWHFCPVVQLLILCSCVVIMIQASVGGQVYRVYTVWEFQLVSPLPAAPSCRLPAPSCSQLPLASELPDNNSPSCWRTPTPPQPTMPYDVDEEVKEII